MVKNPRANAGDAGDLGSVPRLGRFPEGGNSNPFQYSCLKNLMDRGAWQPTVHGVAKSCTWLSNWAYYIILCRFLSLSFGFWASHDFLSLYSRLICISPALVLKFVISHRRSGFILLMSEIRSHLLGAWFACCSEAGIVSRPSQLAEQGSICVNTTYLYTSIHKYFHMYMS